MNRSTTSTPFRWRPVWFRLHWLIGLTAGTVLMLIGLSGAVLSFREEIMDAIDPGARHVAAESAPTLTPAQLIEALRRTDRGRTVGIVTLFSQPGAAARVQFEPRNGERKGEVNYRNPYTAAPLPPLRAAPFFAWVESFHRWLLLPREVGQAVAGTLAACLLTMAASGLYLRWPRRRRLDWRTWLTFDRSLTGRPFLRALHQYLGTFALVLYLASTSTGLYWAFDAIRDRVDAWAGEPRPPRVANDVAPKPKHSPEAVPVDLSASWSAFERVAATTGGWSEVAVRVPNGGARTVQFTWLDAAPTHERARNRTTIDGSGTVSKDERHAAKPVGGRFIAAIYPLHMGTLFGLPGRIAMTFAALMLPVFGITGWTMYLARRRSRRPSTKETDAAPRRDARPARA